MQGLGNDFVVIDDFGPIPATDRPLDPTLARRICDRRFGVGADQLLWLKKPLNANSDTQMTILNADGSTAEMCGNGIRAVALYLKKRYFPEKTSLRIDTLAGVMIVSVRKGENDQDLVRVNMGPPRLGAGFRSNEPEVLTIAETPAGGITLRFHEVSMGNPHAVIFVDSIDRIQAPELGPKVEHHPRFPQRTNVEWVQVTGPDSIRIKVWERGAGETLACGTGACAAAVAALAIGRVQGEVKVSLPGGILKISWAGGKEPVMMEGPAEEVFQGKISFVSP